MVEMQNRTSWNKVSRWYDKQVGDKGHYYHEHVIIPGIKKIIDWDSSKSLLDLACGQGVLGREWPGNKYLGIDVASNLIAEARLRDKNNQHKYQIGDVTKKLKLEEKFDEAIIILAFQNLNNPAMVIKNIRENLTDRGKLLLVINHPAFRVPKHSDWIVKNWRQFRMVDNYMSPLEIPIESRPFDKVDNQTTYSFHYPLSMISQMLFDNGLVIEKIEEWISDKKSEGSMAKIENKARKEIPLFMAILAMVK